MTIEKAREARPHAVYHFVNLPRTPFVKTFCENLSLFSSGFSPAGKYFREPFLFCVHYLSLPLQNNSNNNNNCPTDHCQYKDQWGDLECLYKGCQAARTDGGLFTDTG